MIGSGREYKKSVSTSGLFNHSETKQQIEPTIDAEKSPLAESTFEPSVYFKKFLALRQIILNDINYSRARVKKLKLENKPHLVITHDRKTNTMFKVSYCYLNRNSEPTTTIRYIEIDMNENKLFVLDEFLERTYEKLTQYLFNNDALKIIAAWKDRLKIESTPLSGRSTRLCTQYTRENDPNTYFLGLEIFTNGATQYYHQSITDNSTSRSGYLTTELALSGDLDRLSTYIHEMANEPQISPRPY